MGEGEQRVPGRTQKQNRSHSCSPGKGDRVHLERKPKPVEKEVLEKGRERAFFEKKKKKEAVLTRVCMKQQQPTIIYYDRH